MVDENSLLVCCILQGNIYLHLMAQKSEIITQSESSNIVANMDELDLGKLSNGIDFRTWADYFPYQNVYESM